MSSSKNVYLIRIHPDKDTPFEVSLILFDGKVVSRNLWTAMDSSYLEGFLDAIKACNIKPNLKRYKINHNGLYQQYSSAEPPTNHNLQQLNRLMVCTDT